MPSTQYTNQWTYRCCIKRINKSYHSRCSRNIQLQWRTFSRRWSKYCLHRNWILVTSITILQITMCLSRWSTKWSYCTTQISLWSWRFIDCTVPTRFCWIQSSKCYNATTNLHVWWQMEWSSTTVQKLWRSIIRRSSVMIHCFTMEKKNNLHWNS